MNKIQRIKTTASFGLFLCNEFGTNDITQHKLNKTEMEKIYIIIKFCFYLLSLNIP
jgi:hypothetical protein